MAKRVDTIKFEYRSRKGVVRMPVEVQLSADFKFYYSRKDIPQELKDFFPDIYPYSHKDQIYFDTFYELKESIRILLVRFEKAQIEIVREKIIMYRIKLNGDLTPHLEEGQRGAKCFSDLEHASKSLGFALDWRLGWKCGNGKSVTWHYLQVNDFGPGADGAEVVGRECDYQDAPKVDGGRSYMPWTAEREQWFKDLSEQLRRMLTNIDAFFNGKKPKELIRIIEQNQVLRLAAGAGKAD